MPELRSRSAVIRTAAVAAAATLMAGGALAVVTAAPAVSAPPAAVPPVTTTTGTTTTTTATTTTGTSSSTSRTTSTTRTSFCDPAPPDATLQSATETSLTFAFVSHGGYCGNPGTTLLKLYSENENSDTLVGQGSGSGAAGTITISGLTAGTSYYYLTSGGGSPFGSGWKGPVSTAGTPTGPACVPATNASLVLSRLAVPAGWTNVSVVTVNDTGTVLGNATPPTGGQHGVTWSPAGAFTDLGVLPGGTYTRAEAINASGTVIGDAGTADGLGQSVIWRRGRIATLQGPDGSPASAVAIADDGSVGGSWYANGVPYALRWDAAGRPSRLPGLSGGGEGWVLLGNRSGQLVGRSATATGEAHVVFWERSGRLTDLQARPEGALLSTPNLLSDTGTVVDHAGLTWNSARGFRQLPAPAGVTYTYPRAINATGGVLGLGTTYTGTSYTTSVYRWPASGPPQSLPYLDGRTRGDAVDVNDSGVAIGISSLFNAVPHGTRWDRAGAAQDLGGVTSCDRSEPVAINNAGVIAGTIRLAGTASTAAVPVLWRPVTR